MNSSHYDHEQDERDYYDRESEKRLQGCIYSFKMMLILTGIFFVFMLLFGCVSAQPIATSSTGTVIQVDRDRVLVTFPLLTKGYADQASNWFFIPGHRYQIGDKYPDTSKDPNLN